MEYRVGKRAITYPIFKFRNPKLPYAIRHWLIMRIKERTKMYGVQNNTCRRGPVIMYGFILRFRIQDELNSAYELLREKPNSFTLRKFFNSANIPHRFTLVIECGYKNMIEFMQNYLPKFYSGDVEISLLSGHESEINRMKPI